MDFSKLSSKEMLELVNQNFYQLFPTKIKFMNFARTLVDKICQEKGIVDVAIQTASFSDFLMFYVAPRRVIYISDFYTKNYEEFAKNENYYFLKSFFDSILHELRHHEQYCSDKMKPLLKNYATLSFNESSRVVLDRITYQTRPLEIDARYHTFKLLEGFDFFSPFYKMEAFVEDEKEVDFESYHLVELLKDKDFDKIKYLTKPKRAIEACVKQIAIKNGLRFVKSKEDDLENDYKLNLAIAKEIAPEFYSEDFYHRRNPKKLEKVLNEKRNSFIDYHEEYEDRLYNRKHNSENLDEQDEKNS